MNNKNQSKTFVKLPAITPSKPSLTEIITSANKFDKNITAQAYAIFDMQLKPIIEYNSTVKREIASLTKIMTLFCCIQLARKFKLNISKAYFRVTSSAVLAKGTSAELQVREWVTVEDLFHGMMLPSGNDAASVLGQNFGAFLYYQKLGESKLLIGNSRIIQSVDLKSLDLTDDMRNIKIYQDYFVKYMNSTAKQLQMKDSFFVNPHGLDSINKLDLYSTVQDLAILVKAVLNYQEALSPFTIGFHTAQLKTISGKQVFDRTIEWQTTNKLLGEEGFVGGKTGQTMNAGELSSFHYSRQRNQTQYIVIVLGCNNKQARFKQSKFLAEKYLLK